MPDEKILSARPRPAPGAMCRQEQFGAMLVAGNLPILSLNEDARRIWELCDGKRTVAEIEAVLGEEFVAEGLRERMLEFFHYCLDNGLLTTVGD